MKTKQILTLFLLIITVFVLAACGGADGGNAANTGDQAPQDEGDQISQIYTQAAETLQAEIALTEAAKPSSTPTLQASPTPMIIATNTPLTPLESPTPFPTLPALPTPTQMPTRSSSVAGRPCLRAELLSEYPKDGHGYPPGEDFIKQWNFANSGDCTWNSNFNLIYVGGDLNMAGSASFNLIDISNMTEDGIPNGNKLEISLRMVAPEGKGHYRSIYMLRSDTNEWFGIGALGDASFWVDILVKE